jgi:PPM family protein phosphatase
MQQLFETARVVEGYRPVLEDRSEVIRCGETLVLVVADGAGGRPGGAAAAEGVVKAVRTAAAAMRRLDDPRAWCRVLEEADAALAEDAQAGETTAVVAAVTRQGIAGASVGDSGAWVITGDGYEELTASRHRKPGLGTGMAIAVPFAARRWQGTLLLASDGLLKYASDEQICDVARGVDLQSAAAELVDLVRLRSGSLPDDIAVIVCRLLP